MRDVQEKLTALEDIDDFWPRLTASENTDDYWPRRLLHIPTLTSVQRDEHNVYGTTDKPKYSILTYTWGRWKIRHDDHAVPALPVKGVPWKIPSIKESHFTVDSFQAVIDSMAFEDVEWAWVDIACIDQEDEIMNAEEVGHQVAIFDKAVKVHVWLCETTQESLTKAFCDMNEGQLESITFSTFSTLENQLMPSYMTWEDVHHNGIRMTALRETVDRISSGLQTVLNDPWFSSLWTLQEAVLRNDAVILSAEGLPSVWITSDDGRKYQAYLAMFVNFCNNIYLDVVNILRGLEHHEQMGYTLLDWEVDIKTKIENIQSLLIRSGMYNLPTSNPNIPYSMAWSRQTSRPVDRIYGIMQAYNLRVGKVIRPHENPSLADLVQEFAVAIVNKNPVLSQLFVHTEKPSELSSWRITENSFVPANFRSPKGYVVKARFYLQGQDIMRARGRVCRLTDALEVQDKLVQFLKETDTSEYAKFKDVDHDNDRIRIMTDAGFTQEHLNLNGHLWQLDLPGFRWLFPQKANLPSVLHDLWVFHVGDIDSTRAELLNIPESIAVLLRPANQSANSTSDSSEWADVPYMRVGLCTWGPEEEEGKRMMNEDIDWKSVDFEFH